MNDSNLFESAERIQPVDVIDTMQVAYLDYAMSVIAGRALPDCRDGLKPVQRRILFEMGNMSLSPGRPYRKSARVVGAVMGQWHPHGDSAIYDALARMAQPFSLRYPLIDGHGNFGSIDGDPPAAMRYTECRLTPIAMEMLSEVNEDTVDYLPNFDGSDEEPVLLPSRLPILLMNGAMGVAVGVSTAIPPHNLGEILDGALLLLDAPDAPSEEIAKKVKGPDFPTGGVIVGRQGINDFIETGAGSILVRAKAEVKRAEGRRNARIIITEIPFLKNKSTIIKQIHDAVKRDVIRGIRAIRDESGRKGIRMVFEVSARRDPRLILHLLFKHTDLQSRFPARMVTLLDGVPLLLPVKEALLAYVEHRRTVVRRRTAFALFKAEERAHLVEGLLLALDQIDAIIATIKASKDRDDARKNLQKEFSLSERQADAIVRMQLGTLTGLEREKLQEEMNQLQKDIKWYKKVLEEEETLRGVLREEMEGWRKKYGDARRTKILAREASESPTIQPEMQVVIFTEKNYIKRIPMTDFKSYRRGGQGVRGITLQAKDSVKQIEICWNTDELFLLTDQGKIYSVPVYDVIEGGRGAKGIPVQNYLKELKKERVVCIRGRKKEKESLLLITEKGRVKRLSSGDLTKIMRPGKKVMRVEKKDRIVNALWVNGNDRVLVVTEQGKGAQFPASEIRVMGRTAGGVRAMRLEKRDKISDVGIVGLEAIVSGEVIEIENLDDGSKKILISPQGLSPVKGKVIETTSTRESFTVTLDIGSGRIRKLPFPPRSKLLVKEGDKVKEKEEIVSLPKISTEPVSHFVPPQMQVGLRKGKKPLKVIKHESLTQGDRVLLVTSQGMGKLMDSHLVRMTHRGSKGVRVYALKTPKGSKRKGVGHLARCRAIGNEKEVGIATTDGKLYKTRLREISEQKRSARGVIVISLKPGDFVADLRVV
ncbi:DNA topoisomerase 4 subunit A [bacterium]|nr:DNA topoisomerase 4 subunit A [bacterium]